MATTISAAFTSTREQIDARARTIHLGRVLLTLIAVPLFVAGWIAGQLVKALIVTTKWMLAACAEGYVAATNGAARARS